MVAFTKGIDRRSIQAGRLVRYAARPGTWRVLGIVGARAALEPHDDVAAATCHVSEAYSIPAPIGLLEAAYCGR